MSSPDSVRYKQDDGKNSGSKPAPIPDFPWYFNLEDANRDVTKTSQRRKKDEVRLRLEYECIERYKKSS
jgi:hypothetical protein